MREPFKTWWLHFVVVCVLVAFAGLGCRLVDLQVLQHEELGRIGEDNTRRVLYIPARRGEIRDCRGNPLATTKLVKTVCADPTMICNDHVGNYQQQIAQVVAPILGLDPQQMLQRLQLVSLTNRNGNVVKDQHVVLKHRVELEDWAKVTNALATMGLGIEDKTIKKMDRIYYKALRTRAIFSEDEQLRVYPNASRAAHVLGTVGDYNPTNRPPGMPLYPLPGMRTGTNLAGVKSPATNGAASTTTERGLGTSRVPQLVGKDGIEFTLDNAMQGTAGCRMTELAENRHELVSFRGMDVPPRNGLNVVLTLDLRLQEIVENQLLDAFQKHNPVSASAVVVRPQTGEILAMATLPNFNPNEPGKSPADARRNRVISDIAEPGSTFKIVVVAAALNEKIVNLRDVFDCEQGHFVYAGKVLRDHERYGNLTVEQIITKSSNVGSAKIGLKLGPERLYQYIRGFGFGQRSGIELPWEMFGMVYNVTNWNKLSITRIPMGHEVAVTPLQMVMAMSAIANGGRLMKPMLVNRLEDEQGRVVMQYQPRVTKVVCSEVAARQMVEALKTVVTTNGTAVKAGLDNYIVAGKTGTAQKAGRGGYLPGKYFSSFIGFFPADHPELCISVVLDEPHNGYYGGRTAAPYFRGIAEQAANYLGIKPDRMAEDMLALSPRTNRLTTARSR